MIRIYFDSGIDDGGIMYTSAVVTYSGQDKGHIFFTKQNLGFEDLRCSCHFELLGLHTIISQIMDTLQISGQVCLIGDNARTMSMLNGQGTIRDDFWLDDARLVNHINTMLVNCGAGRIMYSRKSAGGNNLLMYICDSICDWYKKANKRAEENFRDTVHGRIRNKLKQGRKYDIDIEHFDNYEVHAF